MKSYLCHLQKKKKRNLRKECCHTYVPTLMVFGVLLGTVGSILLLRFCGELLSFPYSFIFLQYLSYGMKRGHVFLPLFIWNELILPSFSFSHTHFVKQWGRRGNIIWSLSPITFWIVIIFLSYCLTNSSFR